MHHRIFISGISGLLGKSLAERYLKLGYEVCGTKQLGTAIPDEIKECAIYEGDIRDYDFLSDHIKEGDVVIHCAALVSFDKRDEHKLYSINLEGTKNILQVSVNSNVSKFVYISSIAALGRPSDGSLITENTQWEESYYNTNYAKSKFEAEVEFWRAHEEGLNGLVINPSIILGRGELHQSSNRLFLNLFKSRAFVVNGAINLVDIRDLVDVIEQLIDKKYTGKRFIVNGHKVSIKTLISEIVNRSNKEVKVTEVSLLLAKFFRPIENFLSRISGKTPQLTKETLRVLEAESTYDNSLIKRELGFKFRDIKEALDWCCTYYVEKYGEQQK